MHTGSCLCGAVRFEVAGDLAPIQLCHCSQCRRASGAAFAVSGEASLKSFESSPGKARLFCADCGSPIISRSAGDPGMVRVRAGTLDEPVDAPLAFHFHVASKASWMPIIDDLPRHPGPRPA
jgi:hypothetical protein